MKGHRASACCCWLGLGLLVCALCAGCGGRKRPLPASTPGVPITGPAVLGPARPQLGIPLLIRVGLATGSSSAVIRTAGPCLLLEGAGRRHLARLTGSAKVSVTKNGDRLRWQAGDQRGTAASLFVQSLDPSGPLLWQDTPYPGEILLVPDPDAVTIVNVVDLETYLAGVVPWEIGRHGKAEVSALEAQAVAARTYTIAHLGEREKFGFDVWADVQDQVYRGAYGLDDFCNVAIQRSAGLVLRYDGREIEAYYSSTCGGHTSNVEEVWPRPARPYLRSHRDAVNRSEPFCSWAPHYAWQESWSNEELEGILAETLPQYVIRMRDGSRAEWAGKSFTSRTGRADWRRPGRLRGLTIARRTTSGRAGRLDIATDAGVYHVRGDRVRWVLRPASGQPAILRSALFDLRVEEDAKGRPVRITARGHGYGHGVGLCQTGALAMARLGYSCREILAHYYPGARLEAAAAKAD